jgi:enoyl-CoA hydratase/carnithine racemase
MVNFMIEYKYWKICEENDILWMRLNRPEKKNAFNQTVTAEMVQIFHEAEHHQNLKAIVISTTMDEIFCSGADIDWFAKLEEAEARQVSIDLQNAFRIPELLPIPVIAAVKGLSLTAGFELMLCCDLAIAADNAKFGQIEVKHGLTPGAGGTQRLIRLVGPLKTKEIIFGAKIITAQEALEIGLINQVVPLAQLDQTVKAVCAQMARNSPRAIQEAKSLIQMAQYNNQEGFSAENRVFGATYRSGEPQIRLQKFLKKE